MSYIRARVYPKQLHAVRPGSNYMLYPNFNTAVDFIGTMMQSFSHPVHSEKWQSIDVSKMPEAEMREIINVMFQVSMPRQQTADKLLKLLQDDIKPNVPWADRHFILERVSGEPINPGTTWREWPYALSADKFRKDELFSHTYAERYWPKTAGRMAINGIPLTSNLGIRYHYGDLMDMVNLLDREPLTRQAYLPVWFPEDTGVVHGERVPCTLGYHFLMRGNKLNIAYFIRSCDYVRHFRDDLYLTARLLYWVLANLQVKNPQWKMVTPGLFTFWCGSMHMFINDYRKMFGK